MNSSLSVLTGLLLAPLAALHAAEPFWEKVAPTGASATFHFQPPDSFFGDPIPFYHDGVHHVCFWHGKIRGKRTPCRDRAEIPTKDSVIELRFRFAGAQSLTTEFNDHAYTGSHYGHLSMMRISPQSVVLTDQRDGGANHEIMELTKDPIKKDEREKRMQRHLSSTTGCWAMARPCA